MFCDLGGCEVARGIESKLVEFATLVRMGDPVNELLIEDMMEEIDGYFVTFERVEFIYKNIVSLFFDFNDPPHNCHRKYSMVEFEKIQTAWEMATQKIRDILNG